MNSAWNKIKEYREEKKQAALIRNWYLVNEQWVHLTMKEAHIAAMAATGFRRANVDEELELDGI